MTETSSPIHFRDNTRHTPPSIPLATQRATSRFLVNRAARVGEMPNWEDLRQAAHDLRLDALDHLDELIAQVEAEVCKRGGYIHHAGNAEEARRIVLEIAHDHRVKTVVKSKSMATEEIALNHALEAEGIRAIETDLGEYIIQLAGVGPAHIIAPAVFLTKEGIADLFSQKLGVSAPPDPRVLADIASQKLRAEFLHADMGISGANFIVAETGTVVLVTNEGNGRMVTTLPEVHVAVAGIDKIVPTWDALTVLLKLLARSATGQKISTYTSFITGARRSTGEMGAKEFHLVLLDNGRTRIHRDKKARETLICIRCGACLNVCPVYNHVGGHAYGGTYSGPIGAILSPQLLGMAIARELPFASSLCGACVDVCPVKIPITKILLHLRQRVVEGDGVEAASAPLGARIGAQAAALALRVPFLYRVGASKMRILQMPFLHGDSLTSLPWPLNRWTNVRAFPAFKNGFREWAKGRVANGRTLEASRQTLVSSTNDMKLNIAPRVAGTQSDEMDRLIAEINALSGVARRVYESEIGAALRELVEQEQIQRALMWRSENLARWKIGDTLRGQGVELIPSDAGKEEMARAELGITEADFALPETGTLGLLSSDEKPRGVSLLPRVHLALVRASALRADLHQVLTEARSNGYLVLITGPSRTADIELTLTLGVHGPRALYVWVIE